MAPENITTVEVHNVPLTTSRVNLKLAMQTFGLVDTCHMGNREADVPFVRFTARASAEAAITALKGGQVWLDGQVLSGEWRNSGIGPRSTAIVPPMEEWRKQSSSVTFSSRDLFGDVIGRSGDRSRRRSRDRSRSRERQRDRDRNRDRDRGKDRDRSKGRDRDRAGDHGEHRSRGKSDGHENGANKSGDKEQAPFDDCDDSVVAAMRRRLNKRNV